MWSMGRQFGNPPPLPAPHPPSSTPLLSPLPLLPSHPESIWENGSRFLRGTMMDQTAITPHPDRQTSSSKKELFLNQHLVGDEHVESWKIYKSTIKIKILKQSIISPHEIYLWLSDSQLSPRNVRLKALFSTPPTSPSKPWKSHFSSSDLHMGCSTVRDVHDL